MPPDTKVHSIAAKSSYRVGIYGGSFDPMHNGHLRAARAARESLQLDEVVFVPTGIPPHKAVGHSATPLHRYNMVRLAIEDEPGFRISDIEVRSEKPSYTVDTVRYLTTAQPRVTHWYFIFGDDCAANLHRWKGLDELLQVVQFICICRQGLHPAPHLQQSVSMLKIPPDPTRSSDIRQALATGLTLDLPLAGQVLAYIERQGLYGCTRPDSRALND